MFLIGAQTTPEGQPHCGLSGVNLTAVTASLKSGTAKLTSPQITWLGPPTLTDQSMIQWIMNARG